MGWLYVRRKEMMKTRTRQLHGYCLIQQDYSVPQKSFGGESVVSFQPGESRGHLQQQDFQLSIDYDSSKDQYSYNGSLDHSMGVVPDSMASDVSASHTRPSKCTMELFAGTPIQMPPQLTPMDREARVLRYREKKKTRKFEKTIRYASRKAYAETRPRIKGRFAKRTDVDGEVHQVFSPTIMSETAYGIVPSF